MIDTIARARVLPLIDSMAVRVLQSGLTANKLTLIAFALGLAGCFTVGMQSYALGLALLLAGRFVDGLAGSVARTNGITEKGTVLDVLCDYIIFGAFAFLFSLSMTSTMLASTLLIFSYLAMGMAYLAHAWVLAKKNINEMPHGGIVENGEMILFLCASCLFPLYYAAFAALFALLCWTTAILRFIAILKTLKS